MPKGKKRKGVTMGDVSSQQGSPPSPQPLPRASLQRLPRVLQISCLKYLSPQGIARAASTCEGMREFGTLRFCWFLACACRIWSPHGIAMASGPENRTHAWQPRTWLMCSGNKTHYGCPLSSELWKFCPLCSMQYCTHCFLSTGDDNGGNWQCAECEAKTQYFRDIHCSDY
jgi:hypothetical protein